MSSSFLPLAYLDPGSGSLLLHLIVGLFASAWVFFKAFGHRVRAMFVRAPAPTPEEPAGDPEE